MCVICIIPDERERPQSKVLQMSYANFCLTFKPSAKLNQKPVAMADSLYHLCIKLSFASICIRIALQRQKFSIRPRTSAHIWPKTKPQFAFKLPAQAKHRQGDVKEKGVRRQRVEKERKERQQEGVRQTVRSHTYNYQRFIACALGIDDQGLIVIRYDSTAWLALSVVRRCRRSQTEVGARELEQDLSELQQLPLARGRQRAHLYTSTGTCSVHSFACCA